MTIIVRHKELNKDGFPNGRNLPQWKLILSEL
jgi:hypothetical protein